MDAWLDACVRAADWTTETLDPSILNPNPGTTTTQAPDGPGWEALFPLSLYDTVLRRLRASDASVDVARDVPPATLDAVRTLLRGTYGNFYADKGEIERRLAMLPPQLAASLFSFQREGVRFALERNGRCLIADEVRARAHGIVVVCGFASSF